MAEGLPRPGMSPDPSGLVKVEDYLDSVAESGWEVDSVSYSHLPIS